MSIRSICAWILLAVLCLQPLSAFGQQDEDAPVPLPDGMIQFKSFNKQEWLPIIEYYADAAGLSFSKIEDPPTGTFDYEGGRVMTMLEGLDFLNQMLIPRDRVLIRHDDLLMLFDLTKGIPRDMIESVTPDQLPERGAYEIMKCRFDISSLDGDALSQEVRQLVDNVHQGEIALLPSANALIIKEQGHVLQDIHSIITDAKKSWGQANFTVESIDLEHIAPEELFIHLPMLGVDRDTLSNEEGTLNLSWNPLDTMIIVSGDPQQIARLRKLISEVDKPRDPNAEPLEPPYYQSYIVDGDATKMHDVLQTMLAGRNVNLDVDEDANKIHFRGRTPDHEMVLEIINKAQGSSDELAVFWIKEKDVDDVIETIETLFNLDDDETAAEGPRLAAETQNRLIARGTPNQVAVIRRMVTEIDVPYQRDASSRLPNRILSLNSTERNSTLNLLEDMLPAMGFSNDIRVVMPQDRVFQLDGNSELWDVHGVDLREQPTDPRLSDPRLTDPTLYDQRMTDPPMSQPADSGTPDAEPTRDDGAAERAGNRMEGVNPVEKARNFKGFKGSFWKHPADPRQLAFATDSTYTISTIACRPQQEQQEDNGSGRTSREEPPQEIQAEIPSVDGAPVTIRVTEFGLVLQSEDLEALD
ncbi:MAG: hypothetical protein ACR2NP_03080, partial [Pirellulaceae bacterium]